MDKQAYDFRTQKAFRFAKHDHDKSVFQAVIRKSDEDPSMDLFKPIKEVLIVGRFLGVIPLSGVLKNSYQHLSFRLLSFAGVVSAIITVVLTVNLGLALLHWVQVPKNNALQIAYSIHRTAQYGWGWIIYVTFLFRGGMLLKFFQVWPKISSTVFYTKEDKNLRRDSILICGIILVSCILENGVLHLEYFKELDHINGANIKYKNVTKNEQSALETYYWRSNFHWANVLGYNEFFAILAFVQHKWMLYTWNYLDVLMAIFGRALYFKFKVLYELSASHLTNHSKQEDNSELNLKFAPVFSDKVAWIQVVNDHRQLQRLIQEMENLFSHLIFGSYAVNIYYICIQLLIGLSPEINVSKSIVQLIYGPWSFFHMAIRIYFVTLCLARVNLYSQEIHKVLEECPIELYKGEISRLDKRITAGPPLGLTGLKCFTIRYPFFMSILSVIFTFEIVLLQGISTDVPHSDA